MIPYVVGEIGRSFERLGSEMETNLERHGRRVRADAKAGYERMQSQKRVYNRS